MSLIKELINRSPAPQTPRPAGSLMAGMFESPKLKAAPTPPQPSTETPLPNLPPRTPPKWDRFVTAEKMKQSYRNGWNPNPFLVRLGAE